MESASLHSLIPWLEGVDRWSELLPLLPVLIAFELVLSADNAVALAAIARGQQSVELQKRALNIGIIIALLFRIVLILLAQWVLKFWPVQLIGGIYLLWLFINHLRNRDQLDDSDQNTNSIPFINTVLLLAVTDLAFSVDSVAAAVAISDQLLLVITGAVIGVIALRFTSGLFIHWLSIFTRLETAGYLAVALVGAKLIVTLAFPALVISEWLMLSLVVILFIWGFSKRTVPIDNNA